MILTGTSKLVDDVRDGVTMRGGADDDEVGADRFDLVGN